MFLQEVTYQGTNLGKVRKLTPRMRPFSSFTDQTSATAVTARSVHAMTYLYLYGFHASRAM